MTTTNQPDLAAHAALVKALIPFARFDMGKPDPHPDDIGYHVAVNYLEQRYPIAGLDWALLNQAITSELGS